MVAVTRRTFIKGTAVAGGGVAATTYLFGGFETLAQTNGSSSATGVEDIVPTTCWIGKQDCGMLARRIDGRVVKLEGHPANPRNVGTLCPKGQAQIVSIYDPNRVKTPLIRTNAKGETGEWRQASWGEALALVAERVNEVRERNPKMVLWQKGRSKAKDFYDTAFVKAIGSSKMGHGGYCSDAGYRALEYTLGPHAVLSPDFRSNNYLLAWGWNITNAGGNKFCWLTWPRHMLDAREANGQKIVHIDPRLRSAGPFADNWLPIKPGTDMAFALALCHELIENGFVDEPYLKRYTNAGYLVAEDGTFVRRTRGEGDEAEEVPLVWDSATGSAVFLDEAADPALDGSYEVDGEVVQPSFVLFKEHVAPLTSDWAADITGISSKRIRTVAREFGENAMIGSTTVVAGVEVPYRPVGIMAYHMAEAEMGFQATRAMCMVPMLVGAWGAVGGQMSDFTWKIHKNYEAFENIEVGDPPYDFFLNNSKFYPINTNLPGVVAKVMQDPAKYEVEELPEVVILHMVNPLGAFPSYPDFRDTYGNFKFVAAISPWLSETADQYADVVLPAATIEKYEGPISATDYYIDAKTLRMPPMEPLFESKGEIDIYIDLCEAMGTLFGEDGYIDQVNQVLGLEDEFALPLDTKPDVRDIFDRWSLAQGLEGGIEFFEKNGIWVKGSVGPEKLYGYAADPPFAGAVHRLYGESLLNAQSQMRDKGADEIYWQDYTAFPTWREPTMNGSPAEYDLTLISYKLVEHKQSRTSFNPLLAEIAPSQRLDINPATARSRGIAEGDGVVVESHNAVTGETRNLRTVAAFCEGIRPDTVGMPHHFGLFANPANKDQGPSPNEIYFTGEGYVSNTADQSFHVKVKVTKAGGDA